MTTELAAKPITPAAAPLQRSTHAEAPAPIDAKSQAVARNDAIADLTKLAIAKAGTLVLTPEETKLLTADFADDCFQPGAAGKENLLYIEHAALRDRLNTVLGMGQWVIMVRENWNESFKTAKGYPAVRVYSRAMLIVRGCYVGEAVGEMEYFVNNNAQNYGDAFEGSKTAAFRRCAKEFGIGLQAWRKDWCQGWWQRRGKGPLPAMQRGTDLQPRQTTQHRSSDEMVDPNEANVIDVQAEEPLQQAVDAELSQPEPGANDGPLSVLLSITNVIIKKQGESKKGKWAIYEISGTPDGGGVWKGSTFSKTVAEFAKANKGQTARVDYEVNAKGYNDILQINKA